MRAKRRQIDRIVLAHSGGIATSAAIPWLRETYGSEVVTVTVDLGQGRELADVRDRALALGALRAHVFDVRDEFADAFVLPALQAGALHDGRDPLGEALSLPLVAKYLVAAAHIEGAAVVAHGCSEAGSRRTRLEVSTRALDPGLAMLAPPPEWAAPAELIGYAARRGIAVPAAEAHYAVDASLWGRSMTCLDPTDPWSDPPEDIFLLTRPSDQAPEAPAYVEIEFDCGTPVKINGVPMPFAELIQSLQTIAGAHGVGRVDIVGRDGSGAASRRILEAPAAIALHAGHRELQTFVAPRELDRLTAEMGGKYVDLILNGQWFSGAREAIDAFVMNVQRSVSGTVRMKLHRGACQIAGVQAGSSRSSPQPSIAALPH